jgi:hypothetical protein
MLAITGFAVQESSPGALILTLTLALALTQTLRTLTLTFAVQEFVWSKPVIEQTPFFFGR